MDDQVSLYAIGIRRGHEERGPRGLLEGGHAGDVVAVTVRGDDLGDVEVGELARKRRAGRPRVHDHARAIRHVHIAVGLQRSHHVEGNLIVHVRVLPG